MLQPRDGAWWDSLRIGIGPPLLKTEHGWLLIYHGVKEMVGGAIYRVGLALLDLEKPSRVLHRADDWIFAPAARRTSGRATCRTRSSRAAWCTTLAPASSGSTTAPRTRRSALRPRSSTSCSTVLLDS